MLWESDSVVMTPRQVAETFARSYWPAERKLSTFDGAYDIRGNFVGRFTLVDGVRSYELRYNDTRRKWEVGVID